MQHNQGEMEQNSSGAKRESNKGRGRFDLLPYEALEAWAIWCEEGANKYGPRNWEKGLSVADCINRLHRHAAKASNGWTDEDHLAACMWNAAAAITMMARRPDLNDHPWHDSKGFKEEIETTTLFGEDGPVMTIEEYVLPEKEAKKRQDAINKQLEEEKCVKKADEFNDPSLTEQWKKAKAEFVELSDILPPDEYADLLKRYEVNNGSPFSTSRLLELIGNLPTGTTRLELFDGRLLQNLEVDYKTFSEYVNTHPNDKIVEFTDSHLVTVYRCVPRLNNQ